MAVNNLPNVAQLLETGANQIQVEESVRVHVRERTPSGFRPSTEGAGEVPIPTPFLLDIAGGGSL